MNLFETVDLSHMGAPKSEIPCRVLYYSWLGIVKTAHSDSEDSDSRGGPSRNRRNRKFSTAETQSSAQESHVDQSHVWVGA
ncbi:hypothetical protein AYI68_g8252 [Smittium mucronatum]|uniref:Uncharacterized protein n=1 Tax=Smittium mucronatum TaxID=133383 RepID=A0A1R0GLF5_9FUNG|nr:hypothetical protein AYI68_g8252 [Smittium mucronatum]